ncbi:hypothetical protein HPC49_46155 [Pyxidicoccus fallax]|uniref:hypothetical protein n=1 Tax=Pyxidicoccus fallax TaxID=394095 RepID=UPI0014942929|nr:hypothetical protein [Pyxidicoccus fallax]NPC85562.1 hypothetical protein [Pyxidicoccus fallax]
MLVDSYGLMLHDALEGPERFTHAGAAFESEQSQHTMRSMLERCDFLAVEGRGEGQLSASSERWVQEHFAREGFVWKRISPRGTPGDR